MAARTPVGECIYAFMRRDYESCGRQTLDLLNKAMKDGAKPDFDAVLLHVISLERLGKGDMAFENAAGVYKALGDQWHQDLMMLAIGRGDPGRLFDAIGTKKDQETTKKLWQFYFCFGAQFVSRH